MKKVIVLIRAALMILSLAACGEEDNAKERDTATSAGASVTENDSTDATAAAAPATDTASKSESYPTEKGGDSSKTDSGSSKPDSDASKADDDSSKPDSGSSKSDSGSSKSADGSSKSFATLEEYLADPMNMEGLDELKKSGAEVMDIDVKADGSTLIYDYSYKTVMDSSVIPTVKSALDDAIEASADSFNSLTKTIQSSIEESIKLKVVYRNGDGEIITERTFEP